MADKPIILSKKPIYESRYFRVNQVIVDRNGKQFTKDFIERNSVVYVVALTDTDEVYLVTQTRDALQEVTLELVAGTLDEVTHDPLETAKRELKEEAGLTATNWKKLTSLHLGANMIGDAHVFLATGITESTAHPDDDEDISVVKMPLSEAVSKVFTGEINTSQNVAVLLFVDSLKKAGKL